MSVSSNKSLFGNTPMKTKLSAGTKSSMEKIGPVSHPQSTYELASVEKTMRSTKQYVPAEKKSVSMFSPTAFHY